MHDELNHYNEAMEKSLEDKLFFLDHITDATVFVDFGCANGTVLEAIHQRNRNAILFGIDNNPMQLKIAAGRCPSAVYAADFDMLGLMVTELRGNKVAIFSSVMHEAPELLEQAIAWADYIVIRDMGITSSLAESDQPQEIAGPLSRLKAFEQFVSMKVDTSEHDFDEATMGAAAEFLLKSPYLGDPTSLRFQREFYERYPLQDVERLLEMSIDGLHCITHFEHYSLPYIRDRIFREFGFEFPYPTHFKLILKKVA